MDKIHIGTSGWSYKHWHKIFYPEDVKPLKYLEYYLTIFDCVEINTSFYHLPRETTVTGWTNRVPNTFRFCPKLSRYITHNLKLNNAEEALGNFFERFFPMTEKMGPVLIQLPPSLKYNKEKCEDFFVLLKNAFSDYRFAIEIRHPSWVNKEFFKILEKFGIAFTQADSGNKFPFVEKVTAGFIYIRFHGAGQLYSSDYSDEILLEYSRKIVQWAHEGEEIWVFFNNDINGYAPENALTLKRLIEESIWGKNTA